MTVFLVNGVDVGTAWNIPPCYQAVECGGDAGFIPALKREAFSSILRKTRRVDPEAMSNVPTEDWLHEAARAVNGDSDLERVTDGVAIVLDLDRSVASRFREVSEELPLHAN